MIFVMNRSEAEDYIYKSYLKAEKSQKYDDKDAKKRHPELSFSTLQNMSSTPATVVTGSKGKGSVANMISCLLQSKYKVGLMTSPHIASFCERFRINSKPISDEDFVKHVSLVAPIFDKIDSTLLDSIGISPMAIQAAVALNYFNVSKTDYNVFECGKGARYDDVNNVKHDYAVINTIFLEHTRELGETIEQIADDKSYVINGEQKCVYVGEQSPSVLDVIESRALKYNTPLKVYGRDFVSENIRYTKEGMLFDVVLGDVTYHDILVPLLGEHQAKNCALAIAIVKDILGDLDVITIRECIAKLKWAGRMEIISQTPFVLLDACINKASCANVKKVLENLEISKCCVIVGIPSDKDYIGVVKEIADCSKKIILTKSQNAHYKFSPEQKDLLKQAGIPVEWTSSVEEALILGKKENIPTVILGTTSVVAEVIDFFNTHSYTN